MPLGSGKGAIKLKGDDISKKKKKKKRDKELVLADDTKAEAQVWHSFFKSPGSYLHSSLMESSCHNSHISYLLQVLISDAQYFRTPCT